MSNNIEPQVTIITATYYRPDLLARCIRSVQESTLQNYEHIVVSDHCPKARQVYDLFKEDKRIRFFENSPPHVPNHGARAHNVGIKAAKSEFICYCTDDNIIMPNHLQLVHDTLASGECDVVYLKTHEVRIGRGDNMVPRILIRDLAKDLEPETHVKDDLMYSDPRDMSQLGHTRDIAMKAGPWKVTGECHKGIEDTEFLDRLDKTAEGRISHVPIYSNVYYVRNACFYRDNAYHSMVESLGEDEVFVYPEPLISTGVISRAMLE